MCIYTNLVTHAKFFFLFSSDNKIQVLLAEYGYPQPGHQGHAWVGRQVLHRAGPAAVQCPRKTPQGENTSTSLRYTDHTITDVTLSRMLSYYSLWKKLKHFGSNMLPSELCWN